MPNGTTPNGASSTATRRTPIKTPLAPAAIGPYNQAILAGNTLYCSGQIAIDPETDGLVSGTIEEEAERVLDNLGAVLKAAGMTYAHVVRCTVFLTNVDDYAQVNEVYARYFSEHPPARQAVQVAALPRNARVEISCIAVR
jgi:2-iminobutanoate/2-iminopropanoate deaminase